MSELIPPPSHRDHHRGSLEAAVVLVEYGDYECPDSKWAHHIVNALAREAGHHLCFVYRHFPLPQHSRAEPAAEAAEAAAAQDRFWPMHDSLYENSPALDRNDILGYAIETGLDLDLFDEETAAFMHRIRVYADIDSGSRSGVHATPTFFINGIRYRGGHDFESLRGALMVTR